MRFLITWPEGTIAAHAAFLCIRTVGEPDLDRLSDDRRSQSSGTTDVWGSNV
jgi:hypothetical protein